MESNPGTFGVSVKRISSVPEDDDILIQLTLGDARRLHRILDQGLPNNEFNSIWGLRIRLLKLLHDCDVNWKDLG